jgi:hypothetical protein
MSNQSIPVGQLEASAGAKFNEFGDTYKGRITALDERQQTALDGSPLTFNDGSPRMQFVVTLAQADGETVNLYAKGGNYQADEGSGEAMRNALGTAVRAAGAESLDVGGELAVAFTGRANLGGGKVAKLFSCAYRPPPAASIAASDLFGGS